MDAHIYQVDLKWDAGRRGTVSSPELQEPVEVATPPQFPKGVEGVWSPEHLFTAAVSSCLMTTFLAIAENSRLNFDSFKVTAKGYLTQTDGMYLMSRVEMYPVLLLASDSDRAKAERILQKAEAACLISNSVKSEVVMIPSILAPHSVN